MFLDCDNRLFMLRTNLPPWMGELLPKLSEEIMSFVKSCPLPLSVRKRNSRGMHWFCILGVHRNNLKVWFGLLLPSI